MKHIEDYCTRITGISGRKLRI